MSKTKDTRTMPVDVAYAMPGDTVHFPDAKVTHASKGHIWFARCSLTLEQLSGLGATVTRETKPEFTLAWPEAFDAMEEGFVCTPERAPAILYRLRAGRFEFKNVKDLVWTEVGHAPTGYKDCKWCKQPAALDAGETDGL